MKKLLKVVLPAKMAVPFATWTFNNNVLIQLSYMDDSFFSPMIVAYCVVGEANEAAFTTEFKNYLKAD